MNKTLIGRYCIKSFSKTEVQSTVNKKLKQTRYFPMGFFNVAIYCLILPLTLQREILCLMQATYKPQPANQFLMIQQLTRAQNKNIHSDVLCQAETITKSSGSYSENSRSKH
jgi:hypothetical protein